MSGPYRQASASPSQVSHRSLVPNGVARSSVYLRVCSLQQLALFASNHVRTSAHVFINNGYMYNLVPNLYNHFIGLYLSN